MSLKRIDAPFFILLLKRLRGPILTKSSKWASDEPPHFRTALNHANLISALRDRVNLKGPWKHERAPTITPWPNTDVHRIIVAFSGGLSRGYYFVEQEANHKNIVSVETTATSVGGNKS